MANPNELSQALRPVLTELSRLHVRYCVGGSIASSYHGAARSTLDVDLAAELDEDAAMSLIAALKSEYYVSEVAARDAVQRRSCFNLIHLATSFKIDIFVSRGRPFDLRVQERAISDVLGDAEPVPARIASAEDTMLCKLEWFRLGDEVSERQWSDVLLVAKLNSHRLDRDYLRRWASDLGVSDLLERLLAEISSGGDK